MTKEEIKENVINVCELLNIDKELLKKSPFNLSGVQMRKVAIAGILAYNPDILILDEPTRGLDLKAMEEIMEVFYNIHKNMHKTIIMITHDMNIMYKYATRVLVMKDARLVYDGSKEDLFKTESYKDYHLEKPEILSMIDYLNQRLGLKIPYTIHTKEELLSYLMEVRLNG